jgi:hypothetical protein
MAQTKQEWKNWYYNIYLKSDHWKNKKREVREFYRLQGWEWQCDLCQSDYKLALHHNNYDCLYKEQIPDLDLLCEYCHKEEHANNNKKYYEKIEGLH